MADDSEDVVIITIQILLIMATQKPHHTTTIILLLADCIKKKLLIITWLYSGAKTFNKHVKEKIKVNKLTTKTEILENLLKTIDD